MSYYITLHYVTLQYITSHHKTWHDMIWHYTMSVNIKLHHIKLPDMTRQMTWRQMHACAVRPAECNSSARFNHAECPQNHCKLHRAIFASENDQKTTRTTFLHRSYQKSENWSAMRKDSRKAWRLEAQSPQTLFQQNAVAVCNSQNRMSSTTPWLNVRKLIPSGPDDSSNLS